MLDAGSRANLYAFFSRLFVRELDEAFARVLLREETAELLPAFVASDERAAVADPARRAAEFDPDFTHLTVVNLVPYESFYRRDDAMVEAGLANPLVAFYRSHGFEVDLPAARALSPDHLGIELEFMAELARREDEAHADGREDDAGRIHRVQERFVREHLGTWAPVFLLAVQRNARTLLYREGADALLEFLLTDHAQLTGGV